MKTTKIIGAFLLFPAAAMAAPQASNTGSHLDVYYSNLDFEVESGGFEESIDGNGGGMDFWMGNGIGLFTAEIQSNSMDGTVQGAKVEADARVLRAGMGYRFLFEPTRQFWMRAEYINFNGDIEVQGLGSADDTQNGYAIHAGGLIGTGMFRGYAEIGHADLSDIDGFEYTVGINVQPGIVGGFIEYRQSRLETDDFDIDETFSDFRVGVRVSF